MNEAIGEDRPYQFKDLFAGILGTHDTAGGLTFTSPLAIPVRLWGPNQGSNLFPGWSLVLRLELVEIRPQLEEGFIDHSTRGIQQS
jgi:hypothetical protein